MKKQLILLGAPGSGKGTQAALIVEKYGYGHISTGDLLRKEIASKSELGSRVKSIMDLGNLVDDATVLELLKSSCDVNNKAYIFDGYPRNIEQAKALEENLLKGIDQQAIYFDVDLDLLVKRIVNRRSCVKCGEIYNLLNSSPKQDGICDSCGGELRHRDDDREDVVKNRIDVFKNTVIPVRDYYNKAGVLKVVDAGKGVEEIFSEISELLK
jgi:adenylate kinase